MVSVVVVVGWGRGGGPEGSLHYLRQEKCSASFTSHGKTNRVGLVRERKYRGLLNAKGRRGGGVIGNLTVSLTWKASTHIRDILKNSLDLSLFPAMDCVVCFFKKNFFFSAGVWRNGKRHYYWYCDGCQVRLDSFFPSLYKKNHYTFTTSGCEGKCWRKQLKQHLEE